MKKNVAFIDHYDSFSDNLKAWLIGNDEPFDIIVVPFDDETKINQLTREPLPLVLSPGPKSPIDAWQTVQLVRAVKGRVPIFGVCLGHQILGMVLGQKIIKSLHPFHGSLRNISVRFRPEGLEGLPQRFGATSYNSLVVSRDGINEKWIFAENQWGEIEGMYIQEGYDQPILAVQYHPESFLSQCQDQIRQFWIRMVNKFVSQTDFRNIPVSYDAMSCKTSY